MTQAIKKRNRLGKTLDKIILPPNKNGLLLTEIQAMVRKNCLWSHKLQCFFYTKLDHVSRTHRFYRIDRKINLFLEKKIEERVLSKKKGNPLYGPAHESKTEERLVYGDWLEYFETYYSCPHDEFIMTQLKHKLTRHFGFSVKIEVGESASGVEFFEATIKKEE